LYGAGSLGGRDTLLPATLPSKLGRGKAKPFAAGPPLLSPKLYPGPAFIAAPIPAPTPAPMLMPEPTPAIAPPPPPLVLPATLGLYPKPKPRSLAE